MSLIIRQGLDADRLLINFDSGEMIWTTDSKQLFVGDGVTAGGLNITNQLHNHDASYFLKAEVVGLLSLKTDITTFDSHANAVAEHRIINDIGTSLTDLWSASKILASLGTKAGVIHDHNTLYYTRPEVDALVSDDKLVKVNNSDIAAGYLSEKVAPGDGMTVFLNTVDYPDNRLQFISDVYVAPINGFPMPVYKNAIKGNKILSAGISPYYWSEARVGHNDWVEVGTARDSRIGHIMPFDGTIVGATFHVSHANGITGSFTLFKNAVPIFTHAISRTGEYIAVDTAINIDFDSADKLRWRFKGGTLEDTLVSVLVQWRA